MYREFMSFGLFEGCTRNLRIYSRTYYKASSGTIFTSSLLLSLRLFSAFFFGCFSFLFIPHLFVSSSSLCKSQMTSSFAKVRKNDVFLAGEIRLDRLETIRIVEDEEGNVNGLNFTVPNPEARNTDHWRGTKEPLSQTGHFHVIFLYNGLRFPLSGFILELLHHYDIAPSQLAPTLGES